VNEEDIIVAARLAMLEGGSPEALWVHERDVPAIWDVFGTGAGDPNWDDGGSGSGIACGSQDLAFPLGLNQR
jgi:hypothetical protein